MHTKTTYFPKLEQVEGAMNLLKGVVNATPLTHNLNYSKRFNSTVLFKREDLQQVRSYKIRGAYNKIACLTQAELKSGIVCASAGNHAQGVAYSCRLLKTKGKIFMPTTTPNQKIEQVYMFGGNFVSIELVGDTFDDAQQAAEKYCKKNSKTFVHPFDDKKVIEGQGTIALELLKNFKDTIDYLVLPVGGGGLLAGVGAMFKLLSPNTKIIAVEPKGAPSLSEALIKGCNVKLDSIDKFVDGAAVKQVGSLNFEIAKDVVDDVISIDEGLVCETILQLYNKEAMVVEPAGALSVAALELLKDHIGGKNVVCLISGSNNDISRTEEMKERALLYKELKHYFTINFPQRAGALKEFVSEVLGPNDDITFFEYNKKNNRESGPATVGIQLKSKNDLTLLIERMKTRKMFGNYLNEDQNLLNQLI